MNNSESYMEIALSMARKAAEMDEVPVGAVIVHRGKVIGKACNMRESQKNPIAHAEILAIQMAAKKLKGWRLPECSLYVTLEPCPMCAGAIINARIENVYFGAYDNKAGAFGSLYDFADGRLNHTPSVVGGWMEEECASILRNYFQSKRGR